MMGAATQKARLPRFSLVLGIETGRVVNLPGNKSISQGSGKYREILGNTGKYREIGNQWAHNYGWQILWPVL